MTAILSVEDEDEGNDYNNDEKDDILGDGWAGCDAPVEDLFVNGYDIG